MATLYVTSLERGAGKTMVCAGIGKHLLANGRKVGFLKPLIAENTEGTDSDAKFMKVILALDEPVESLAPVIGPGGNLAGRIKEAHARVSQGKDVVVVEGMFDKSIPAALGARVIIVEDYSRDLSRVDVADYRCFEEYLLGVVINKVPKSQVERVSGEMAARLVAGGINLLGVLPEDRALSTLTVGGLAEVIGGEILNNAEKSDELVENFMLGAMYVDCGPEYFGRKINKAVVLRGERPDMQLAALETSTRCLVLGGNTAPMPAILNRAREKQVPIILAKGDTAALVASIENGLDKTRFSQERKLPRLTEIMERYFNFPTVYGGLGLAK